MRTQPQTPTMEQFQKRAGADLIGAMEAIAYIEDKNDIEASVKERQLAILNRKVELLEAVMRLDADEGSEAIRDWSDALEYIDNVWQKNR